MTRRKFACALALAISFSSSPLLAHELGVMQVDATFGKDGTYVVDLLIDREHLTDPEDLHAIPDSARLLFDGKDVEPEKRETTQGIEGKPYITRVRLTGRTPPQASRFSFADDAISGYFVVTLRNEGQEAGSPQWVEPGKASDPLLLDRSVVPLSRWRIIKLYAWLGFTHILPKGLDHVLFVLGIFLLAVQLKPVLWQVTAFTVAHTITLALTIYGVVSLSPTIVEPLIALSIVYVAVENIFTSKLHAWRPLIVFCFGLLHGMGFAGVLNDIGLPRSEFVPALLAFNAGVEGGQLTVILAAFVTLGLPFRNKPWYRQRIVIPGSLMIAAVGLYWSVQRIFLTS